jgi:hypothetical protein
MGILRQRTFKVSYAVLSVALLGAVFAPLTVGSSHATAAALPAYRYSKSFNTSGPGYTTNRGVATDSLGDVYVTGFYSGTVTFGGSDTFTNNNGNAFLSKYSNDGTYQWTKTLNISASGAYSEGLGVATDSNNNVYMTGFFGGNVTFGTSDTYNGGSNTNAYVVKYSNNGTYAWAKAFNVSASGARGEGHGVAVSKLGDVYITGQYSGTVTFGGSDTDTSGGYDSAFLTRYDSDGTYGWTKDVATASGTDAIGSGVATDSAGNAYFTGQFAGGTVVFGATDSLTSSTNNGFISKYSRDGTYGWAKKYATAGSGTLSSNSVAASSDGSLYTVGDFAGNITFGNSDSYTGSGGSAYISKYTSDGSYGWTKALNTSASGASANGYAVTADSAGNAYLTGKFAKSVTFGGAYTINSANASAYVSQYASDGTYNWTKSFDTSASGATASSRGVASDANGNIYLFGDSDGSVKPDTSSTITGSYNGFLVSYQAFLPPILVGNVPSGAVAPVTIPNAGDANGDGIQDSTQPNISGTTNTLTHAYMLVQAGSGCTVTGLSAASEDSMGAADNGFSYPAGLVNFTVSGCGSPGYSTTVTQYYYGVDSSNFVLRKYNSATKRYTTINTAAISKVTIGGQAVIKAVYQVTDGGDLDQDGTVNGTIVDPAGLALASTPDTGFGTPQKIDAMTIALSTLAVVSAAAGLLLNRRQALVDKS